ncbi:MAG: hypothetical protein WC374_12475 [Phycisphaerae bacterium]|jgi:hypothetical protein
MEKFTKRQKSVIKDFIVVIVIVITAVVAMMNFKDYVNRREAMRAMQHLGRVVLAYRDAHKQIPSQYYVDEIKTQLEGSVRLGNLVYRARWIGFGAGNDEILAYAKKDYGLVFGNGYIVLRLDGRIEWMEAGQFEELLDSQQSAEEKKLGEENI